MAVSGFIRNYGGVVWTNHALERLKHRRVSQDDALAVLRNPDETYPGKKDESVKFIRTLNGRRMHVVGVLNEQQQWVVTSGWVRGEEDRAGLLERAVGAMVDWVMRRIVGWVSKRNS